MNPLRRLICLSDSYRAKLYDLLEAAHPEAFDDRTREASRRADRVIRQFLSEQLKKDGIELNDDGFDMLLQDFACTHHFYARRDEHKRKNG